MALLLSKAYRKTQTISEILKKDLNKNKFKNCILKVMYVWRTLRLFFSSILCIMWTHLQTTLIPNFSATDTIKKTLFQQLACNFALLPTLPFLIHVLPALPFLIHVVSIKEEQFFFNTPNTKFIPKWWWWWWESK